MGLSYIVRNGLKYEKSFNNKAIVVIVSSLIAEMHSLKSSLLIYLGAEASHMNQGSIRLNKINQFLTTL